MSTLTTNYLANLGVSMQEALAFGNQIADTQNDKALAALRGFAGTRIHTATPWQIARLRWAVQSVHQGLA